MEKSVKWKIEVIMNLAMATAMSLTADLMHGGVSARTLLMILLGFVVGMILSCVLPYGRMSAGLCRLFRVEKRKLLSHLIGTLPPAVIQTLMISAVMTAVQVLPHHPVLMRYLSAYVETTLVLIPVAYAVSLVINPLAVRLVIGKHGKENNA